MKKIVMLLIFVLLLFGCIQKNNRPVQIGEGNKEFEVEINE